MDNLNPFRQLEQEKIDGSFIEEDRIFVEDNGGKQVLTMRRVLMKDGEPAYIITQKEIKGLNNLEHKSKFLNTVKTASSKPFFDGKNFPRLYDGEISLQFIKDLKKL